MEKNYQLITILGPTASGKTSFAADLEDYVVNGKNIPYHLINICNPGDKYNVYEYQHAFFRAFDAIRSRGKLPILCGGTGLYIEAVLKGYKLLDVPPNPALREALKDKPLAELEQILSSYKTLHNKTDVDSAQRAIRAIEIEEYYRTEAPDKTEYAPIHSLIIGIDIERELRRERISQRLVKRLDEGMLDEIRQLLDSGIKAEDLIYYGLEYKYLTQYIIGELTYAEMVSQLEIAIHQFAKRQMTWFRGMERRGFTIHWIDALLPTEGKIDRVLTLLASTHHP